MNDISELEGFRSPSSRWVDFLIHRAPITIPGPILRFAYRKVIAREGGAFYSPSVREWLKRDYNVTVGPYSYGPCLTPGEFPPGVTVKRYVSIASGVRVSLQSKPMDRVAMHPLFYEHSEETRLGIVYDSPLVIEDDAWIGDSALILPGCKRIGIGAVVGGGAVVTRDVPDFAIVGGNPAKILRYRFDEITQNAVLASRWWLKSFSDLKESILQMNDLRGFCNSPAVGGASAA